MCRFLFYIFFFAFSNLYAQQSELRQIATQEKFFYTRTLRQSSTVLPNNYDLKYIKFNWSVNPSVKYISGQVSYLFFHTDSLNEFKLELSDSLTVDSVSMSNILLSFNHNNGIITIDFGQYLTSNNFDSIKVFYHGIPPSNGFGSFAAETHGVNDTPVLWTLSEPYGAKDWWPTKQDLNDKIDSIDVFVKAPLTYKVASNGLLINEINTGLDKITHWKHKYPIASYLIAFSLTDYTVLNMQVPLINGNLNVINYVYDESVNDAQIGIEQMLDHLIFFDSLYGPYPFMNEKYGHAQFNWGGGMEHQTMSFVGNFSYELLAHELAHQWFGDRVTCGSWQDLWLNEGFATYSTGLCYERFSPNLYWKIWKSLQVDYVTSAPDGSVFVTDTMDIARLFSERLTYSKAAMVLHMMRWKIGDNNFFNALRNYQNNPLLKYNYARNVDLKSELELQSGQNLDEFFNDWYFGEGYPSYQLSYDQNASNILNFSLSQTQSHSSVSFFEMPVPILFKNANQDTTIVFDHTFSGQSFIVPLNFKVDSVIIDPTHWIVCNQNVVTKTNQLKKEIAEVQLYPNPTKENIIIKINSPSVLSIQTLGVFDLKGSAIASEIIPYEINQGNLIVDTQLLNAGIYTLILTTKENNYHLKFVKQ
jgi:aminopeptidase N